MSGLEVVGVLLAAAALSFVLVELGARLWLRLRRRYYVWPPGYRGRYEVDTDAFPMLEPVVEWEINAAGERGSPLPVDLGDTYRVLTAGASATEGYFLDQKSTWPGHLEVLLQEPEALRALGARQAHVGNIARSLMTIGHLVHVFEHVLPRYERLDLMVLFPGASEVVNWTRQRAPAEWRQDSIPIERTYAQHPEGPFGWTPRRLALRRLVSAALLRLRRPVEVRERIGKSFVELRRKRAEAQHLVTEHPDATSLLEGFEESLRKVLVVLKARARRVLVVPTPWFEGGNLDPEAARYLWNFGYGRPEKEAVDTYYHHDVVSRILRQVSDRAVEVARDEGCEALDLMPLVECTREHYYDYVHHTPSGNRRVAEEIAKVVLSGAPGAAQAAGHEPQAEVAEQA